MRKTARTFMVLPALLAACIGVRPYSAPRVKVAPAYAAARDSVPSPRVTDSCATRPAAAAAGEALVARSVHFDSSLSPEPFWRPLGDSTLTRLVEEALRANTDVRAAAARLSAARASRRLASLDLGPTVTASGSAARQRLSAAQVPGVGRQLPEQELWDVGVDASWELDVFGRVNRNVRAQSALAESAVHGLHDAQVSVAAEVVRSYFELRGAQQQLAVAQRNAENQRRTVSIAEDRLAAGRGTAFDTERARSALYLTLSATPALESQIEQHRRRIAVLLGRAPGSMPEALLAAGELPRLPDTLRVGSPRQLVARRPDVLRAERQLAAQGLLAGAARAEYLPRLGVGARAGYVATAFDSLARPGTSRFIVGPVLSWPLLDLARVHERVGVAQARMEEARAEHDATVLRAVEETEAALVAYDRAYARLATLEAAVRSSTRAAELAQQRFEAGLTDFLQVLDAQRTQLDAESQLAQGHTAAATALVAVYKALGGTWPIR